MVVLDIPNIFSKKIENHAWAVSLRLMHCNFARIQRRRGSHRRWPLALPITSGRWSKLRTSESRSPGKARAISEG